MKQNKPFHLYYSKWESRVKILEDTKQEYPQHEKISQLGHESNNLNCAKQCNSLDGKKSRCKLSI